MSNRRNLVTGAGLAVGSMFVSQFAAAVSVPLLLSEGAISSTALRLGCAALFCIVWARPNFLSFGARQWRSAVALGFVVAVMAICFYVAATRIPIGAAMTIEFLGPLAVAALSLKGLRRVALPLLAVGGVVAMTYGHDGLLFDSVGVMLALAAACGWGGYIVLMRHVGGLFSEQEGLCVALIVSAILAWPVGMALEPDSHITSHILYVAGLALLWPFTSFAFEMMALRRMPLGPFSILMSLEPAFGALLGYVILDQKLSPRQIAGIIAVMIASIGAVVQSRDSTDDARDARNPMGHREEAC
ncbi:EamA family transporter [Methylosinus sp. LW4]|uniref:EamA family transporter n=1 Tax=Methylosinus sp. LW4 TaxID=136993 RepID=UPI0003621B17|nr:EamA family transporter [Methylosinus sp. LW4]